MKLYRVRGGVHPDDWKRLSADRAIENLPMPPLLHIPLQQHIGAPAEPLVRRGQLVRKGQLLARNQGLISAPVHAPTSGPHRGYPVDIRPITPQGSWYGHSPCNPTAATNGTTPASGANNRSRSADEIAQARGRRRYRRHGRATFPSSVKLNLRKRHGLRTLVINGAKV
ncbi:MAG: hypothetical protein R3E46_13865 [Sedimenticolaceae bacterium]